MYTGWYTGTWKSYRCLCTYIHNLLDRQLVAQSCPHHPAGRAEAGSATNRLVVRRWGKHNAAQAKRQHSNNTLAQILSRFIFFMLCAKKTFELKTCIGVSSHATLTFSLCFPWPGLSLQEAGVCRGATYLDCISPSWVSEVLGGCRRQLGCCQIVLSVAIPLSVATCLTLL